jgi:hypothetical protein
LHLKLNVVPFSCPEEGPQIENNGNCSDIFTLLTRSGWELFWGTSISEPLPQLNNHRISKYHAELALIPGPSTLSDYAI